jgi:transposase
MEVCASAHYWGRTLVKLGHDARRIAEAVTRPHLQFVQIKTEEAQAALMLHRTRRLLMTQRTMLANALRSHFTEFGIVEPEG